MAANLTALRTLRAVQADQRPATADEQTLLARWASWGAVPKVFDDNDPLYAEQRAELRALLTPAEFNAAARTTVNAHYTDLGLVAPMWRTLRAMGFHGGRVLEPGCGSGNFICQAPADAAMTGIELDPTTAAIAGLLYPDARIKAESFANTRIRPGTWDAVIANVPFASVAIPDRVYNPDRRHSLHDHFLIKSVDALKPGAVLVALTSTWTLDKADATSRRELHALADLIGAVRLPAGSHQAAAGTRVVTDVLVLRRRLADEEPGEDTWLDVVPAVDQDGQPVVGIRRGDEPGQQQNINAYYGTRPDQILGRLRSGGYNGIDVAGSLDELPDRLTAALDRVVDHARVLGRITLGRADTFVDPYKDAAPAAQAEANDHYRPPSARTLARRKAIGQLTHLGAEVTRGKSGRARLRVAHRFSQVDLDGDEIVYRCPETQAGELAALLRLRDLRLDVIDAERESVEDTDEIRVLREDLRDTYEAYVAEFGPVTRVSVQWRAAPEPAANDDLADFRQDELSGQWQRRFTRRPPMGGIRQEDPTAGVLTGLETDYDEATNTAVPATALTQRQIGRQEIPTTAVTIDDALSVSLQTDGRIDLGRIASLLGLPDVADARGLLGNRVFKDHRSGELIPARKYLSGDVRAKLAEVTQAAQTDPELAVNVTALHLVVPVDKDPTQITVRPGAGWVPEDVYEPFIRELTGNDKATARRVDGRWTVKVGSGGRRIAVVEGGSRLLNQAQATGPVLAQWGTGRRNAYELFEALLRQQRPVVEDTVVYEWGERQVVNEPETRAAIEVAEKISGEFNAWIWRDTHRARNAHEAFNAAFRSYAEINYVDSDRRAYPGMTQTIGTAKFDLDGHQNDAVWRAVEQPAVLLDHEVGTGKTFTMVAAIMEKKRLGQISKPIIVVPNHLLEQVSREATILYPHARMLIADSDTLKGTAKAPAAGRRRFLAQAAGSDWDAVVITRTAFASIPLSPARIETLRESLLAPVRARFAGDEDATVKRRENALLAVEAKFDTIVNRWRHDEGGLSFEDAGFDYLVVDEAHGYKNDEVVTGITGLAMDSPSGLAIDMRMKLDWLREDARDRGRDSIALFATGTPVTNSAREWWVMMRFLRPDLLAEAGVADFDDFAATFLEVREAIEPSVTGSLHVKLREGDALVNTGELKRLTGQVFDTVTATDVGLQRPKLVGGQAQLVPVNASANLLDFVRHLAERREQIVPRRRPQPGDDTVVAIGTDGLTSAVDLRLVPEGKLAAAGISPDDLTEEDSKVPAVGRLVLEEWARTKDQTFTISRTDPTPHPVPGGLQLVFCDKGVPKPGKHSFYQSLKDHLVAGGVPAGQIAFIHDAEGKPAALRELSERCRTGEITVLIGSTAKMGTGLNVQNRLTHLIHADGTYRPDEIEQRNGRILRRGNQLDEVRISYVVVEGSTEGFQWAHVARKDNFLRQFAEADLDATTIGQADSENASESDMLKALAAGNPLILDEAQITVAERRLRAERRTANATADYHANLARNCSLRLDSETELLGRLTSAAERIRPTRGEDFTLVVPQGRVLPAVVDPEAKTTTITKRAAAAALIAERTRDLVTRQGTTYGDGPLRWVGTLGGLRVWARASRSWTVNHPGLKLMVTLDPTEPPGPVLDLPAVDAPAVQVEGAWQTPIKTSTLRALEDLIASVPQRARATEKNIADLRAQEAKSTVEASHTWPREAEYQALLTRQQALRSLMRLLAGSQAEDTDETITPDPSPASPPAQQDTRPEDPETAQAAEPKPTLAARLAEAQDEYGQASQAWKDLNDQHLGASRSPRPSGIGADKLTRRGAQRAAAQALREFVATSAGEQGSSTARTEDATTDSAGRDRDLDPATVTIRTIPAAPAPAPEPAAPAPAVSAPVSPTPPPSDGAATRLSPAPTPSGSRPAASTSPRPAPDRVPTAPRSPEATRDEPAPDNSVSPTAQPSPRPPRGDPRFRPTESGTDGIDAILDAYRRAQDFYRAALERSVWAPAYLASRLPTVDPAVVEAGHAPAGWTALVDHLRAQGVADRTLVVAGLAREGARGLYDVFRDRLVFPIRDTDGNLVAFTGRAHPGETSENTPKWLNSPAHPAWRKRSTLSGLDEARTTPPETAIAIVEGTFDQHAITIATRGSVHAVAPLGTGFSHEHAQALHRNLDLTQRRIIIATDTDPAGHKAAEQIHHHLVGLGARPERLVLAEGTDPGQAFQTLGPDRLAQDLTEQTRSMVEVLIDQAAIPLGETPAQATAEARVHALRQATLHIAALGDTDPQRGPLTRYAATRLAFGVLDVHESVKEALVRLDPAVADPEAAIAQLHQTRDADDLRMTSPDEHSPAPDPEPDPEHTDLQGEAMAKITIEHTATGTLVLGTDKNDAQAQAALRDTGFKWSARNTFWYLNSKWLEPTRRARVQRLQTKLTGLGRDHDLQTSDHWRTAPAGEPEPTALSQLSAVEQAIVRRAVELGAGSIAGNAAHDQSGPDRIDAVAQLLVETSLRQLAASRGGYLVARATHEVITEDPAVMDREIPYDERQQILDDRAARAKRLIGEVVHDIGDNPWDEAAIARLEEAFHQAQILDPGQIENDETKWGRVSHHLQTARRQLTEGHPLQRTTPTTRPPSTPPPPAVQETLSFEPGGDQDRDEEPEPERESVVAGAGPQGVPAEPDRVVGEVPVVAEGGREEVAPVEAGEESTGSASADDEPGGDQDRDEEPEPERDEEPEPERESVVAGAGPQGVPAEPDRVVGEVPVVAEGGREEVAPVEAGEESTGSASADDEPGGDQDRDEEPEPERDEEPEPERESVVAGAGPQGVPAEPDRVVGEVPVVAEGGREEVAPVEAGEESTGSASADDEPGGDQDRDEEPEPERESVVAGAGPQGVPAEPVEAGEETTGSASAQDGQRALAGLIGTVGGLTADVVEVQAELKDLSALIDTALRREGSPTPVPGSGRVEQAVRVLDDAYDALRPHLRTLSAASSPYVEWLKESRTSLLGVWDKAVALSESAFAGISRRLRRATHNAASLMYVLAEKIAPRLPNNPVTRKAVEVFRLGAALVAQSTRDTKDDDTSGDSNKKMGRITKAMAKVRSSVPDVTSLPGGKELLAMVEAIDKAQATAYATQTRISRELNLPSRITSVVSVTARKIAARAGRLSEWMRDNGRDGQQVEAVQHLSEQAQQVAEQTQSPAPAIDPAAVEERGPAAPIPGSVRSNVVGGVLSEQLERRLAAVIENAHQAGGAPMPSTADSRVEDMVVQMRARAQSRQEDRPGHESSDAAHTRDLRELDVDMRRLHLATAAFAQTQAGSATVSVSDPVRQRQIEEVFRQIEVIQRRGRAGSADPREAEDLRPTAEPSRRALRA